MRSRRPRGRNKTLHLGLELLEARCVPAQFGVPWHDARHLSVSFVPDGTVIAGHTSSLFQALDAQAPEAVWQRTILEAFQAWALQADINFSVTTDGGEPFGAPGPDQHDPRFGDIRIGAQPMSPEVLAVAVPHDPFLSGTWSGDILINSAVLFGPDAANLLPVMLHEVGHVLGLDHSSDPSSVMFSHLNNQNTTLAASDIAAVQNLYGPRPDDPFEGSGGNDTLANATPFPTPTGYDGTTPLFLYADVASPTDTDVFSLQAPAGYQGSATFRLQSAGVSMLAPRLTIYDASGNVVADIASTALGGDTLTFSLPQIQAGATYYVAARSATGGVFGAGEYALSVSFDARSTVSASTIDAMARHSYSYLSPDDINALFLDPNSVLFHNENHTNDTFATAEPLSPANASYDSEAPDRITASLGPGADVDVYQFQTPEESDDSSHGAPLVVTVTVRATEVNGIMPLASVFDAQHHAVPAQVLAHGDGTYTIQVADAEPDTTYFVQVTGDPSTGKTVGNYDLDIEFGHTAADPTTFVASTVSPTAGATVYELSVHETQLFEFLLAVPGVAGPGASVTMILTDHTGRVVSTRTASPGATAGGDAVLLVPGDYRAVFLVQGSGGALPRSLAFRLYGASLSDPIGPALDDPTLAPIANPSTVGPLPPIISASGAPYQWLALTLAAPRAPSPSEPAAPAVLAQDAGASAVGVLGSVVATSSSSVPAAVQASGGFVATAGSSTLVPSGAVLGRGQNLAPLAWELSIGLGSVVGTGSDVCLVPPGDPSSEIDLFTQQAELVGCRGEAPEEHVPAPLAMAVVAAPLLSSEEAPSDSLPFGCETDEAPPSVDDTVAEAQPADTPDEAPGMFIICVAALLYSHAMLRQNFQVTVGFAPCGRSCDGFSRLAAGLPPLS